MIIKTLFWGRQDEPKYFKLFYINKLYTHNIGGQSLVHDHFLKNF
ncbi:MAG: hypothetical protein JWR61_4595 [Ferruginibacter sp.]|nr:hypothetical protein [Ferruginibacter sp.]